MPLNGSFVHFPIRYCVPTHAPSALQSKHEKGAQQLKQPGPHDCVRGVLLAGVGVQVGLFVIQRCLQDGRGNFEVLLFSHGGGGDDKKNSVMGKGLTGGE